MGGTWDVMNGLLQDLQPLEHSTTSTCIDTRRFWSLLDLISLELDPDL